MKKLLLLVVTLVLIGSTIAYFMYNKPHKDMGSASADFKMAATELFEQFDADETAANAKYLDKVIEVEGSVLSVSEEEESITITLEAGGMLGGVICQLDPLTKHEKTSFAEGEKLKIKGICTGMLMDVVLVRCVIL